MRASVFLYQGPLGSIPAIRRFFDLLFAHIYPYWAEYLHIRLIPRGTMDPTKARPETYAVQTCRHCSDYFIYELPEGRTVRIIVGEPKTAIYVAASYVWGKTFDVILKCNGCTNESVMPMAGASRFANLARLAGPDHAIWIDAISIDQGNPTEIQRLISMMGTIYKNARWVAVLLPKEDKIMAELLEIICGIAKLLLAFEYEIFDREVNIGKVPDDIGSVFWEKAEPIICKIRANSASLPALEFNDDILGKHPDTYEDRICRVCYCFFRILDIYKATSASTTYMSRAWTLQEWALARDLEVTVEDVNSLMQSSIRPGVPKVKRLVLRTAIMLLRYKMQIGQYAIWFGFSRGAGPIRFASIRRMFPDEELFTYYKERDQHFYKRQASYPTTNGFNQLLCLRQRPYPPEDLKETRRRRLCLMLDTFDIERREARYEADLVACWASMCDISYPYNRMDTLDQAVYKVVKALREAGIRVFNFHACAGAGLSGVDFWFHWYSLEHRYLNWEDCPFMPGAGAWTGRVDTVDHYLNSLTVPNRKTTRQDVNRGPWWPVKAEVDQIIPCHQLSEGQDILPFIRPMDWDNEHHPHCQSTMETIRKYLQNPDQVNPGAVQHYSVIIVKIFTQQTGDADSEVSYFRAWALCSNECLEYGSDIYVTRERINGTLMLCASPDTPEGGWMFSPIAYLTISDEMCGTFLLPTDEEGNISITLEEPIRPDSLYMPANRSHHIPYIRKVPHSDEPFLFKRWITPNVTLAASKRAINALWDYIFSAQVYLGNPFTLPAT